MRGFFFRRSSASLTEVNALLRRQIDEAHLVNQKLAEDFRRISSELQQVRDELTKKTRNWQEEERVCLCLSLFRWLLFIEQCLRCSINIIIRNII